jgi:vitamin B12 transporter
VTSRGVEIDASLTRGPWSLSLGYSHADARAAASGAAAPLDGLRPAQTPRDSAAATLAWARSGVRAALSARYVGAQFEDDRNEQLLPDALTFDAALAWPLGAGLALELRAENLLDERVVAGVSGAGIIEQATPRTLWAALRLNL